MTILHWILIAIIAVVALIILGDAIADGGHKPANQQPESVTGIRG